MAYKIGTRPARNKRDLRAERVSNWIDDIPITIYPLNGEQLDQKYVDIEALLK